MKNRCIQLTTLIVTFISLCAFSAQKVVLPSNCADFFQGSFIYEDSVSYPGMVKYEGDFHYEYYSNGHIKSNVTWFSDCSFELKIIENTVSGSSLPLGDKLRIDVLSIQGSRVEYEANYKGNKATHVLIKKSGWFLLQKDNKTIFRYIAISVYWLLRLFLWGIITTDPKIPPPSNSLCRASKDQQQKKTTTIPAAAF